MEKETYIIIGFSTSKHTWSPIPKLIRAEEGTNYSHTYARFTSQSLQRTLVYHAARSFMHFLEFKRMQEHHEIIKEYLIPISEADKKKCLQYCVDMAGTNYGALQLLGMGIARVVNAAVEKLKLPLPQISNPFADGEKTEVCSEAMGHILIILKESIDSNKLEYLGPKYIDSYLQNMVSQGRALKIEPGIEYLSGEVF